MKHEIIKQINKTIQEYEDKIKILERELDHLKKKNSVQTIKPIIIQIDLEGKVKKKLLELQKEYAAYRPTTHSIDWGLQCYQEKIALLEGLL